MTQVQARRVLPSALSVFRQAHIPSETEHLPSFPLDDPNLTEPVEGSDGTPLMVPSEIDVKTRRQLRDLVLSAINGKMTIRDFIQDHGLQAWLACKWHQTLRRHGGNKAAWHSFETPRLIPTTGYSDYYRHCIGGIVAMHHAHEGENIDWLLDGVASVRADILEQIYSVPHLASSRDFMEVVNTLYHDPDATYYGGTMKDVAGQNTGFKKSAGGNGAGSVRRLPVAYWQFYSTYRIDMMSAQQIISLLPPEFDKFKPEVST